MTKFLKWGVALFLIPCLIICAGAVFVQLNDLDAFRRPIERLVTNTLGRNIQIAGRIKLNLFPDPELILNQVSIANAEWGSQPNMLELEHLAVSVDFKSLFTETIIVKKLVLNDAALLVEKDEAQGNNWKIWEASSSAPEKTPLPQPGKGKMLPVMAERIDVADINLTLILPDTPPQVYHLSSLNLDTDASDNIRLKSAGKFLEKEMIIDSRVTSRTALVTGKPVSWDLKVDLGDACLKGQFSVRHWESSADFKGQLNVGFEDLAGILKTFQIDSPLHGPLTVDILAVPEGGGTDIRAVAKMTGIRAIVDTTFQKWKLGKINYALDVDEIDKILTGEKISLPLTGPLTAKGVLEILDTGYKADLNASADRITAVLEGAYTDGEIQLNASLSPLERLGELFKLDKINSSSLVLNTRFEQSGKTAVEIRELTADIGENQITAQGRLDLNAVSDLLISVSSPDLKTLWDPLPNIPFTAKTSARYSARDIALSNLSLTADASDLKGDLVLNRGSIKHIKADLTSDTLDLRFLGDTLKTSQKKQEAETKEKPNEPKEAASQSQNQSTDHYLFKDTPLPLAPLQEIEADLKLSVTHLYHQVAELKNLVVDAALHGGEAETKLKFDLADHGHAAALIGLKTSQEHAAIDARVSLADIRLNLLDAGDVPEEERPPLGLSLELQSQGASPRELASGANGKVLLTQGPGKTSNVKGGMLTNDIVAQLVGALNPFAEKEKYTHVKCTIVDMALQDGQATLNHVLAESDKLMVVGGGNIDLKTEDLNIEFNTIPISGVGISADMFVTPFIFLTGSLTQPSIGLNAKSSLLHGSVAIATGGMSILLKSVFDRATTLGGKCEEMRQEVGEHAPLPF